MSQDKPSRKKGTHDGHKERMRKRFIENGGFKGFSDHEVLEILLNYANVRKNTNEVAHNLITTFGSLVNVFGASKEELLKVEGVGETTATLICIQRELFSLFSQYDYNAEAELISVEDGFKASDQLLAYIASLFAGIDRELLYVMCVNRRGKMLDAELLGEGSSDCVILNQRKLYKTALNNDAVGVFLVHNHLTGIATPSNADVENTKRIQKSLEEMEISLIDHYVYADNKCVSILSDIRYKYMK